jgi:membrane-bound transcription factor site-1 protease
LPKETRLSLLNEAFRRANVTNFSILKKNDIFNTYPSDFDVVKATRKLSSHETRQLLLPTIKHIYENKKLTRTLKSDKSDLEEEEEELDEEEEEEVVVESKVNFKKRRIFRAIPKHLVDQLRVNRLWSRGISGAGVNVAVFDTGLSQSHPHFKNVVERIDWTDEHNADDQVGHGTFVCGLIASSKECLGLAPDVNLYVFKVFAQNQISYTSWFLDAFNYAILKRINVLNLSIGGPDFMVRLFFENQNLKTFFFK